MGVGGFGKFEMVEEVEAFGEFGKLVPEIASVLVDVEVETGSGVDVQAEEDEGYGESWAVDAEAEADAGFLVDILVDAELKEQESMEDVAALEQKAGGMAGTVGSYCCSGPSAAAVVYIEVEHWDL